MFRILAAAAVFFASTASAQLSEKAARSVLDDVNVGTLAPVLRNAGMTPQTTTILGQEALVLKSRGQTLILRPRVCNPNCTGLLMYTIVGGLPAGTALNRYNESTAPTTAYAHKGNTVLSRYLIADHGITAGTFLVNVAVFNSTVEKWLNDSSAVNPLSVSVGRDEELSSILDKESEAFLTEVLKRPDLLTRNRNAGY